MRVVALYVEDETQEAVLRGCLLREVQERLRDAGFILRFRVAGDVAKLDKKVRRYVANALGEPDVVAVFALRDVHAPTSQAAAVADTLRARMHSNTSPADRARARAHVVPPEIEAWLLADANALRKVLRTTEDCGVRNPEEYGGGTEPKERLDRLFGKYLGKHYKPTADGARIAREAIPDEVAHRCPRFRAFANDLLGVAGLEPLY